MALSLPYTLAAGSPENINQVQANFDAISNSFPLAVNTSNFSQVPQVRVTHNTTQAITTSFTSAVWNTETYDTGTPSNNMHDTGSNTERLTCRVAGLYIISVYIDTVNAVDMELQVRLNGATTIGIGKAMQGISYSTGCNVIAQYRLAVNDYVDIQMKSSSATNAQAVSYFQAVMVSV